MESEGKVYCYDNREKGCGKKKSCLVAVIEIFLIAFTLSLGILIGALASAAILASLAAIIVFIVIMGILLVASIILYICYKKKNCKKH